MAKGAHGDRAGAGRWVAAVRGGAQAGTTLKSAFLAIAMKKCSDIDSEDGKVGIRALLFRVRAG